MALAKDTKIAWSRLRQKSGHFLPDNGFFVGRSSGSIKKTGEMGREMGLFGSYIVPPIQLLKNSITFVH
jgi:hypothetical protein